jgi:D-alanyl-D-alanine carboxypeptidase
MTSNRVSARVLIAAFVVAATVAGTAPFAGAATRQQFRSGVTIPQLRADARLDVMLERFVFTPGGPPGIAVVVNRGGGPVLHTAGVANVATRRRITLDDHMRLASVAKAFSGAASLSVVADGRLSLDTTIGQRRPDLPQAWWPVTLRQLLQHTSGVPDFSQTPAFGAAVEAAPFSPPPPRQLLSFVENQPLLFPPGSQYRYSNSDNIIVGLMVEAATGRPYEAVLQERVYRPLGLTRTSLPRDENLPEPAIHGYFVRPLEDVTELFAAGWAWASGGVVSTPRDADRFIRGYAAGRTTNAATRAQQFQFIPGGHSEPPGPGVNAAGLAIFRYETSCGTVYGHTGNTPGYTQFIAATADGSRSTVVSINAQITPKSDPRNFALLRDIFGQAVCAALA